ncbi:MAG: hypothetical protein V4687_11555 [Bacteroidota bacterium]
MRQYFKVTFQEISLLQEYLHSFLKTSRFNQIYQCPQIMRTSKVFSIFTLFIFLTALNSCKKDVITVQEYMEYYERVVSPSSEWKVGLHMILMPNGEAEVFENGYDRIRGSYNIRGKTLIVTIPKLKKYKFKIISEGEIYGDNGKTLILRRPVP